MNTTSSSTHKYARRIIYMPGNSGLKKTKEQIELDFNPLTNGTMRENSHLGAVSVCSFTSPTSQKLILRKKRSGLPLTVDTDPMKVELIST